MSHATNTQRYTFPGILFPARVPTLQYLPNCLRAEFHCLHHDLFSRYVSSPSEPFRTEAFSRIFAVPKLVLRCNGRRETGNRSCSAFVLTLRSRMNLSRASKWEDLYTRCLEEFPLMQQRLPSTLTPSPLLNAVGACFETDEPASALLQTDPPVRPSPEALPFLQSLHPVPSAP